MGKNPQVLVRGAFKVQKGKWEQGFKGEGMSNGFLLYIKKGANIFFKKLLVLSEKSI